MTSRYLLNILIIFVLFSCGNEMENDLEEELNTVELEAIIDTDCPTFNAGVSCELRDISKGHITSREWIFENAEPSHSSQQNPVITFEEGGTGTITLVIHNDNNGLSDTARLDVVVYPGDGLIAYYPLDNSGDDFSGNAYHGLINGTTSVHDADGSEDGAIRLSHFLDYVETSSEIDDFFTNGVTFSAWIKTEEEFDLGPIISNYSSFHIDTCQSYTGFQFYYGTERGVGISYSRGGRSFGASSDGHNNFGTNEWHHVAASWNGALEFGETKLILYIDGENSPGSSNFNTSPDLCPYTESPIPFYIGHPYDEGLISTSRAFIGCLDEIRIYGRALDAEEIEILARR